MYRIFTMTAALVFLALPAPGAEEPFMESERLFPIEPKINHHGSCIVEAPNGDIIICWYRGRGERGHNVAVVGARKVKHGGTGGWSEPFVMADTPGFPDNNPCMIIDQQGAFPGDAADMDPPYNEEDDEDRGETHSSDDVPPNPAG